LDWLEKERLGQERLERQVELGPQASAARLLGKRHLVRAFGHFAGSVSTSDKSSGMREVPASQKQATLQRKLQVAFSCAGNYG
jgi:hypothetical protein